MNRPTMNRCFRPVATMFAAPVAVAVAAALATGVAAAGPLDKTECIAPAKPGGGFDLTCKLAQSALMESKAISDPMRVTFYRSWRAFPHTRVDQDDDIMVSVEPNSEGEGGTYEFSIRHVGTHRRRRPIALRVDLFADSWRAFHDLPCPCQIVQFFAALLYRAVHRRDLRDVPDIG